MKYKKILILDTETTGLPADMNKPYTDTDNWPYMLSVAWEMYDQTGTLLKKSNYITAPREGVINSQGAMAVNKITPELQAEHGKPIWYIAVELTAVLLQADLIIAHNVAFDKSIIRAEFHRASAEIPARPWLCTKEISADILKLPPTPAQRKYRPEITYKQPRLDELYQYLFNQPIPGRETHHGAAQDAAACAECFWELVKRGIINPA